MLLAFIVSSILVVWIVGISIVVASVAWSVLRSISLEMQKHTIRHSIHQPLEGVLVLGNGPARHNNLDLPPGNTSPYCLVDDGRSRHRNDPVEGVPT